MLGCLEGDWVFVLDLLPLRSLAAPAGGLLSLKSDTFINLGLGVLNIVRFSLQRALQTNIDYTLYFVLLCFSTTHAGKRDSSLLTQGGPAAFVLHAFARYFSIELIVITNYQLVLIKPTNRPFQIFKLISNKSFSFFYFKLNKKNLFFCYEKSL